MSERDNNINVSNYNNNNTMVKASPAPKTGLRADPEAIERRRMQNRLAQRKRRLKRAQMAREEKERQQRAQAAQAASRFTFMNEAYLPMGQQPPLYHEQKIHPMLNNYYTSTPPHFEDIFSSSPYISSSPLSPFENDLSFVTGYPSPSLSGYAPSTPPLSIYTPSLVDEDLSNSFSSSASTSTSDLDPNMFLGSAVGSTSSSAPSTAKTHALDAFGLVPLHPLQSPRLQRDRHRSTSLPTPFTPPRSVPSLASPPPPQTIARSQTSSMLDMMHRKDNLNKTLGQDQNKHNYGSNLNMDINRNSNPNPSHANAHTHGKTGLHVCAEQGNAHIVQLLLGYGADVNCLDEYGCTPLHYAVRNHHPEVVKLLIERGAATSVADINGISPMHVAAESGSEEIMQLMTMITSPVTSSAAGTTACNNPITATMTTVTSLPAMTIPAQDTGFHASLISSI